MTHPKVRFPDLFSTPKPILGMLHLIGTDHADRLARAEEEARIMVGEGIDGLIVENYFGPADDIEGCLDRICGLHLGVRIGINVLGDTARAFHIAGRHPVSFLQINSVAGHLCPTEDDRYREALAASRAMTHALILGGVRFKYQKVLSGRPEAEDVRLGAARCDAIVVTSEATGQETDLGKLARFRDAVGPDYPLIVGAGMTEANVAAQLRIADGGIVGSWLKDRHLAERAVSPDHVARFMTAVRAARQETSSECLSPVD